MARRIVVLDFLTGEQGRTVQVIYWADVPVARRRFYASPTANSAFLDATAAEVDALRTGAIAERLSSLFVPTGTPIATLQAWLQTKRTEWQTTVIDENRWTRYGTAWDDTTGWTVVAVP